MSPIKVAIIGGGIGGCAIANGLMKHKHIQFDVYEGSSAFKEQGLSVGIQVNAQNALDQMGLDAQQLLRESEGVKTATAKIYMGEGPDTGKLLMDIGNVEGATVTHVHRAKFLQRLLAPVPKSALHVNKKLVRVEDAPQPGGLLTIHFSDGSSDRVHALIGSDGIHSTVRRFVDPSADPVYGGFWDARCLVSMDEAKERGIVDPVNPSETGFAGDGGLILYQFVNNGHAVGIFAACADKNWDPKLWRKAITREDLQRALGERGRIGESVTDAILRQDPTAYAQFEVLASTFANGPMCVMGDAAHATTPWQGSGAGMSIEDAMLLSALLEAVDDAKHIPAAFAAYSAVRKPRTHRLIESSRSVGLAVSGRDPDIGMQPDKFQAVTERWHFIWQFDAEAHVREALQIFEELKTAA